MKKAAKNSETVLTQEQLAEINNAYGLFCDKKISEEDYVSICLKHGYRPIDKRVEKLYDDNDNSSRIGFSYCCYNHEKGKYFQNVLKIIIRKTLTQIHSLIIGKDKVEEYKDLRLTFLDKFGKEFIDKHIGNDQGGLYKKGFSGESLDILLWLAENDIRFRTKLLTFLNTFADKKTLFELNEPEQFNDQKFG